MREQAATSTITRQGVPLADEEVVRNQDALLLHPSPPPPSPPRVDSVDIIDVSDVSDVVDVVVVDPVDVVPDGLVPDDGAPEATKSAGDRGNNDFSFTSPLEKAKQGCQFWPLYYISKNG